jgi:hypothetical protein
MPRKSESEVEIEIEIESSRWIWGCHEYHYRSEGLCWFIQAD